jgi:hypothetical protein
MTVPASNNRSVFCDLHFFFAIHVFIGIKQKLSLSIPP